MNTNRIDSGQIKTEQISQLSCSDFFDSEFLSTKTGLIYDAASQTQFSYSELVELIQLQKQSLLQALNTGVNAENSAQQANSQKKSLIFLEASNRLQVLVCYLAAIQLNQCVMLVDAQLSHDKKDHLKHIYQPELIAKFESETWQISSKGCSSRKTQIHPDICLLLTTSGSTGSPKLVKISRANLLHNSQAICQYLPIDPQSSVVTSLPLFYSFGLSVINTHLAQGASIVLTDTNIMQKPFWALVKEHLPTGFYGVPYTFQLMSQLGFHRLPLASINYYAQAGGAMPSALSQNVLDYCLVQQKQLFIMYGQTEATARMAYLELTKSTDKIGYIGKAIPNGEFKIINEAGNTVDKTNIEGELCYRGANVGLGIAESPDDLKHIDMSDWLHTGDIALVDELGNYKITGRLKRFIKLSGKRVNLDEAQVYLQNLIQSESSQLIEMVLVGQDDKLQICHVTNNESQDILVSDEFLISQLSNYLSCHPKFIQVYGIKAIPMTANNKIDYVKLTQLLMEKVENAQR
ncbi:AMP-binding protein [Catenovulum maritimum]|uniref:AMP-binding protein n=1 Tax=Catenovulum maritimum TaxID=1513271 RepID=UPI000B1509A4|nr:AMP-binding protein [Catenovulum maritimum]